MKKADAILTGDIEIRSFQPTCRTDDHWKAQQRKFDWLNELRREHDCPILDSGDLFDKKYKSHPSHELLIWAMRNIPDNFYTVPGNHDLPGKAMANYGKSAMAVLESDDHIRRVNEIYANIAGRNIILYGFGWGVDIKNPEGMDSNLLNIALVHAMVYEEFEPWPGCEGYSAKEVLDLMSGFDLIVTGHNHQTFTLERGDQLLVNPGSLMRNDADQVDHKPCVFLWYAESNRIKKVFAPIEEGVVSREHIEVKKEKNDRLSAFVEKLGTQELSGINFAKDLETASQGNGVTKPVQDKIWQYYEGL